MPKDSNVTQALPKADFKCFLDRVHKALCDAGLGWEVMEGLLDYQPEGSLIVDWFYEWMQE